LRRPSRSRRLLAAAGLLTAALVLHPAGGAAGSGELLWPLPFREGCTSSFGEFRLSHFHVGVDMRTRQQEGWPVTAVGDGAVVRVRREPDGYGRVLYLALKDGRTAVYGHLCRYSRALGIEGRLQEVCAAKGSSFPGDVVFDPPIAVRRGETLAFSGQLGLGSPHLHFELRRGDDACDPFLGALPLPDGMKAPEIQGAVFAPRDAEASVDGSFRPVFVAARPDGATRWRLLRPVRVHGAVDVQLAARDHLGIPDNTTGVPRLGASLDGSPFFTMDLTCVSLAHYKQSPLLFDPSWTPGGAPAYLLRKASGISFSGVEGGGLPADLPAGEHHLEVTASNRAGLSASLEGLLRTGDPAQTPGPLSLRGSGYRLQEAEVLPAGLWLTLTRASSQGVTPLLWGGRPVEGMRVEEASGAVHVLLPREAAPRKSSVLTVGAEIVSAAAAAGPCTLDGGPWSLEVPAGGIGLLDPKNGEGEGASVRVRCGPYPTRAASYLTYRGTAPARAGLWLGTAWLRRADGKPVPVRFDGVYALREDRSPPRWGNVHLATVPNLGAREVRAVLTDEGSGPDPYSLRVTLDGKPVFPDWDSEVRTVRLDLTGVAPGRHTLAGSCSDRAGNRAALPPLAFAVGGGGKRP